MERAVTSCITFDLEINLMSPDCDECGKTFDTLVGLRLHDCASTTDEINGHGDRGQIQDVETLIAAVEAGDGGALEAAVATYSASLGTALENDDGERYRDRFWEYYEPLATHLDQAVRADGWPVLREFVDAYDPEAHDEIPPGSAVIENAVGRYIIRRRISDGVSSIEVDAFDYLDSIIVLAEDRHDIELEETHPFGWGIGHPDHAVGDRIHELTRTDPLLANATLEHAFYADQEAAIDLLERMIDDESIRQDVPYAHGDISIARCLLDAPAAAASDFWPNIPRYWDWREEFSFTFHLSDGVERRTRDLVTEVGLDEDLSDEWKLSELIL